MGRVKRKSCSDWTWGKPVVGVVFQQQTLTSQFSVKYFLPSHIQRHQTAATSLFLSLRTQKPGVAIDAITQWGRKCSLEVCSEFLQGWSRCKNKKTEELFQADLSSSAPRSPASTQQEHATVKSSSSANQLPSGLEKVTVLSLHTTPPPINWASPTSQGNQED